MQNNFIVFVVAVFLLAELNISAQTKGSVAVLDNEHAAVLQKWLATKPTLRLATLKDYTAELVKSVREIEGANFVPYYVAKDFNSDRKKDFAVIVVAKKGKKSFSVAVFNAPLSKEKKPQPAFYSAELEPDDVLYFNPNTKRLLVGPFESDAGFALEPSGKTYKAKTFNDDL